MSTLLTDVGPTDVETILINSVERIGIKFRDTDNLPLDPEKLSLEISYVDGYTIIADTYLPLADRDPNPPRIINPSVGVYEFPLGLDNGSTDLTKKNRTNSRCDLIFIWRANTTEGAFASVIIDPGVNPDSSIVWTSVAEGTPGNFITVTYVDPGTPNAILSIIRSGADITVSLATDGFSVVTTTAAEIIAAVALDTTLTEIITAALPTGESGTGVVGAVISTPLSDGVDSSEEIVTYQNVRIVTHRVLSLLQKLRLQIDKALKIVNTDPDNPCFLGYTDGQLLTYLEGGIQTINAYQPSGTFTFDTYPYSSYEFILIEAALVVGVMSQQLFAVDTDIPSWNDQGNAFVIQHQPQLAQYLNALTQRLDKMIPMLKLNFVSSGSLHIEAGPNYRLAQLINAAPSGSLFRNVYFKG